MQDFITAGNRLINTYNDKVFKRLISLEKKLKEQATVALNLSNYENKLPINLQNAVKMYEELNAKCEAFAIRIHQTEPPIEYQTKEDYIIFMQNKYLGLTADLNSLENEIAIGSAPIIVTMLRDAIDTRNSEFNIKYDICDLVSKWPAEVRNSSILMLHNETLSLIATFDPVLDLWQKVKAMIEKKLKFKRSVAIMKREELDAFINNSGKPTSTITNKWERLQVMRNGIGSLVDFRPFLAKNQNLAFTDYMKILRANLKRSKMPQQEKNIYATQVLNEIYKFAEQSQREDIAINWAILYNAILFDVAADIDGIKRIEDTVYYYHSLVEASNNITNSMKKFIEWKSQNATKEQVETFKKVTVDPLIITLKNMYSFLAGAIREPDPAFKAETGKYKTKLNKCVELLDRIPQTNSTQDEFVGHAQTIATIKERLQVLGLVISGQLRKTCSLVHILRGQNCLSDMAILTPDNFEVIKNYVDKLYARLSKYEPKGFSLLSKKVPKMTFPELIELLYLHELKLGGEVKKYSAFVILAILIVVLLYLIFTHLLSKPSADYKIGSQLDIIKAPIHLKSTSTVNYSNWADI